MPDRGTMNRASVSRRGLAPPRLVGDTIERVAGLARAIGRPMIQQGTSGTWTESRSSRGPRPQAAVEPAVGPVQWFVGRVIASTPTNETVGTHDVVFPCSTLVYAVRVGIDPNDTSGAVYSNLIPRVRQFEDVGMKPAPDGALALLFRVRGEGDGAQGPVRLESVEGEWVPTDPDCPEPDGGGA